MSEPLAPPDIEPAVVSILSADPPWVGTRYPANPEDEANGVIRVSATGGPRPVDRVVVALTVLIECWHDDAIEAQHIAQRAYARLNAAAGTSRSGVSFKWVASTSPNNNPDVNRPRMERFQFLSTIHTRLVLLEV